DVDVLPPDAGTRQADVEILRGAIHAVDVVELRVGLAADPRVDDQGPRRSHEQGPHPHGDAVPRVGRRAPLPQRLRYDAEHGAAVEAEIAVEERHELEVA